jgi:quinol monooxygenase YgiN
MVFTCLSHDVIAHETTHALLDGFHRYFMEPTNPDVLAFHEAFADIVALFQHFTFPEVLAHQIAKTRGNLSSENLLAQLATQFGHARGTHGALRDAIGKYDPEQKKWVKHVPDPTELDRTTQVHARGAILVAAVFDAFLSIYQSRTLDLLRLASGGTGILPQGELHPDLVNRLAQEAAKSASHVLNMCIRALDYCPPVDLTFGEYLRALITADIDLQPEDRHGYRVAFIEAFRRRGIYPDDVRTLSEDSLRWARPGEDPSMPQDMDKRLADFIEGIGLRPHVDKLRYRRKRWEIWETTRAIRRDIYKAIKTHVSKAEALQILTGLALSGHARKGVKERGGQPVFSVYALREARRQHESGSILNQVFLTLLQKEIMEDDEGTVRCGSTLVFDLDKAKVTYVIRKGLQDAKRRERTRKFRESQAEIASLAATYLDEGKEPFAALHRIGA